MTKEELDNALYHVEGYTPLIIIGPGHNITRYEGWGDPYPEYYRGVPVMVHEGWGERCEVLPMDVDLTNY